MTGCDRATLSAVWLCGGAALLALSQVSQSFPLVAACAARPGRLRPVFWFPDYFCNEAAGLLRDGRADVATYPVTPALEPDWAACEALARHAPPDVFVLVHFFGRAAAAGTARAFCDRHGARLLEDATHVLRPVTGIGEAGDFVCFSPRKFFDVPDGGLLVVRDPHDACRAEAALRASPRGHPDPTRWRLKRLERAVRRFLRPARGGPKPLAPIRPLPDGPPAELFRQPRISPFSSRRLAAAVRSGTMAAIAADRLSFESDLAGRLAGQPGVRLVERQAEAVPCWYGLACADERSRVAALDRLRSQGVQTLPWPNQLPPEALAGPRRDAVLALRGRFLVVVPPRSGG